MTREELRLPPTLMSFSNVEELSCQSQTLGLMAKAQCDAKPGSQTLVSSWEWQRSSCRWKHVFPKTHYSFSAVISNFILFLRDIMERERYSRHCLCNSQAWGNKCPGVITDLHLLFFRCIQCLFENVPEGRYLDYETVSASQMDGK